MYVNQTKRKTDVLKLFAYVQNSKRQIIKQLHKIEFTEIWK